ncbi:MAG: TlpA family protein disulfide reductase [Geodermatophilaceae bacterium]|jgi:thiol-disulfide isomerase/thioredoxin|nr:TlpA family protein disulfide reductase [Geodermatophilaceae bacterium]
MRRVLALTLVLLAGVLAGCATGSDAVDVSNGGEFRFVAGTPDGEVIDEGDRASAPEFSGVLLDGSDFDSSSLAGDIVVINFWGSWCAPCRVETPEFQQVYDEVSAEGVSFLGINVKDDRQLAQAFLDDNGIAFPSVFDPRGEIALAFRDYPANAIPSTIILDQHGRVAAVYVAVVAADELRRVLDTLVAQR